MKASIVKNTVNSTATLSPSLFDSSVTTTRDINTTSQIINETTHVISGELDYTYIKNKPMINSVTLEGDKTFGDLGLPAITNLELEQMLR